jgi:iron complex outermembrane receptor protein
MTLGQLFINGDVKTGKVRHRVLGGVDMGNKEYFADWGQYHVLDSVGAEFNSYDPNYGVPANGFAQFNYSTPVESRALAVGGVIDQTYSSAYVQDELGFFDNKLRLTLAGRYTNVRQSEFGGAAKVAEQFTPRVGLSGSVNKATAIYALYDQAFIPQTGRLANNAEIKPITGDNMEVGVKKDWFDGRWNTTLSVYRIVKNNELTADPNSPPAAGLSIVMGQKTAEGVEFDLRGRIAKGFNLIANYAYTDSRITKAAAGLTDIQVGDIVPGYAKHTANGWLTYTFQRSALKGAGISGGVTYLSGRMTYWDISPDPKNVLPNYLKVDGGIFWEKENFRVTANLFNILNDYLYTGSYYKWLNAYYWQTEPGRNFRLSVNYKF